MGTAASSEPAPALEPESNRRRLALHVSLEPILVRPLLGIIEDYLAPTVMFWNEQTNSGIIEWSLLHDHVRHVCVNTPHRPPALHMLMTPSSTGADLLWRSDPNMALCINLATGARVWSTRQLASPRGMVHVQSHVYRFEGNSIIRGQAHPIDSPNDWFKTTNFDIAKLGICKLDDRVITWKHYIAMLHVDEKHVVILLYDCKQRKWGWSMNHVASPPQRYIDWRWATVGDRIYCLRGAPNGVLEVCYLDWQQLSQFSDAGVAHLWQKCKSVTLPDLTHKPVVEPTRSVVVTLVSVDNRLVTLSCTPEFKGESLENPQASVVQTMSYEPRADMWSSFSASNLSRIPRACICQGLLLCASSC